MLVVTGGEPLEHPSLSELLIQALEHWARVEVETSGILPPPLRHERLSYNVSPKLPSATERWAETWRHIPHGSRSRTRRSRSWSAIHPTQTTRYV
jgi:organic radical activating enzyme